MSTVADLCCEPVVTISPSAPLAAGLALLVSHNAAALYVVDAGGRLLGVVPDFALLQARCNGSWHEATIEQVMSPQVICFSNETGQAEVLKAFRESQHARAAILEQGRLIGQITRMTVLRSMCCDVVSTLPRPKFLRSELSRNALTLREQAFG